MTIALQKTRISNPGHYAGKEAMRQRVQICKTTETTRTVKVMDFVQEYPPAVLLSEALPGPSGRLRLFTQKVQVPDTDLWKKLTAEVEKGETLQVTVKTVWPESGSYYTCLDSFARISVLPAPPLAKSVVPA